jgi:hypothetical protein
MGTAIRVRAAGPEAGFVTSAGFIVDGGSLA